MFEEMDQNWVLANANGMMQKLSQKGSSFAAFDVYCAMFVRGDVCEESFAQASIWCSAIPP